MGLSSLQWRDSRQVPQGQAGGLPLLRRVSLTLSAKPLSRDGRMLVPRKTQGLYFKTLCQKSPLEHIQPLDRVPEGQTAAVT